MSSVQAPIDPCGGTFATFNGIGFAVSIALLYISLAYRMRSSEQLRKIRMLLPLWFSINLVQAVTHFRGAPLWVEFVTMFTTHYVFFIFFYVIENMITVGRLLDLQTMPRWMTNYFVGIRMTILFLAIVSSIAFVVYPRSWTGLYRNIFHYSLHFPLGVPTLYGSYNAYAKVRSHMKIKTSASIEAAQLTNAVKLLRRNMIILWTLFWGGSVIRAIEIADGSLDLSNYDLDAPYEEIGCDWNVAVRWIISGAVLLMYSIPSLSAIRTARADALSAKPDGVKTDWLSCVVWCTDGSRSTSGCVTGTTDNHSDKPKKDTRTQQTPVESSAGDTGKALTFTEV